MTSKTYTFLFDMDDRQNTTETRIENRNKQEPFFPNGRSDVNCSSNRTMFGRIDTLSCDSDTRCNIEGAPDKDIDAYRVGSQCFGWINTCTMKKNRGFKYNNTSSKYICYKPLSTTSPFGNYYYSSNILRPVSDPVVYGNSPNAFEPGEKVTFEVKYSIPYPSPSGYNEEIRNLIQVVHRNSREASTKNTNLSVLRELVRDYCNQNACMDQDFCQSSSEICPFSSILGNQNICPTMNSVNRGWLSYCGNLIHFQSPECRQFYQNSRSSLGVMDDSVSQLLQTNCRAVAFDNATQRVKDDVPLSTLELCGCYFPQSVYSSEKQKIAEFSPELQNFLGEKQCFYPHCVNSLFQPREGPSKTVCPSPTITTCIQNTTVQAGGNISGTINMNQFANCFASTSTNPSSVSKPSTPSPSPSWTPPPFSDSSLEDDDKTKDEPTVLTLTPDSANMEKSNFLYELQQWIILPPEVEEQIDNGQSFFIISYSSSTTQPLSLTLNNLSPQIVCVLIHDSNQESNSILLISLTEDSSQILYQDATFPFKMKCIGPECKESSSLEWLNFSSLWTWVGMISILLLVFSVFMVFRMRSSRSVNNDHSTTTTNDNVPRTTTTESPSAPLPPT